MEEVVLLSNKMVVTNGPKRSTHRIEPLPVVPPKVESCRHSFCLIDCKPRHIEHLYKELISRGWAEVQKKHKLGVSTQTLKGINPSLLLSIDDVQAYGSLPVGAIYNHFEGNRAITTKEGLATTLEELSWSHSIDIDNFFPRTYSLSSISERNAFITDYRRTLAQTIVRRVAASSLNDKFSTPEASLIPLVFRACRIRIRELQGEYEGVDFNVSDKTSEKQQGSDVQLVDEEWQRLSQYMNRLCLHSPREEENNDNVNIDTKIHEYQAEACRLVKLLSKYEPQWNIDGLENIWIVKPGDRSKGLGISLHQNLEQILRAGKQRGPRIVQKYIENPMTTRQNMKFDIRVWVLVTSFDPLEIYIYSPFYCRVCKKKYSTKSASLSDRLVHLSNVSVQNKNDNQGHKVGKRIGKHSSFLSQEELCMYLESLGIGSQKTITRIEELSVLAIRSSENRVKHRARSFEVYGVDILLDENANPWLLEVNLSPGLSVHMKNKLLVKRMIKGMTNIILNKFVYGVQYAPVEMHGWKHGSCVQLSKVSELSAAYKKLSTSKIPTSGIRFLLRGRRRSKRQIERIDLMLQLSDARKVLKSFIDRLPCLWQFIRLLRKHARLRIVLALKRYRLKMKIYERCQNNCATLVQNSWKQYYLRKRLHQRVRNAAVSKIQLYWLRLRQFREERKTRMNRNTFKQWIRYTRDFRADIIKLQSLFRMKQCYNVRIQLLKVIFEGEKSNKAALRIQMFFQHFVNIRNLKRNLHRTLRTRQKTRRLRSRAQQLYIYMRIKSATKISKCWRRYSDSLKVLRCRSANIIQFFARGILTKKAISEIVQIKKCQSVARRRFSIVIEELTMKSPSKKVAQSEKQKLFFGNIEWHKEENSSVGRRFKKSATHSKRKTSSKVPKVKKSKSKCFCHEQRTEPIMKSKPMTNITNPHQNTGKVTQSTTHPKKKVKKRRQSARKKETTTPVPCELFNNNRRPNLRNFFV